MVFEPNFTKVVSSVRKNIGTMQSVVEVKLPTNDNDIVKVVSVGAKSVITSSEVMGRDIVITGLVDFQAVYQSAGLSAVDYSAEFRDKYVSNDNITGEVILSSNIVDVNSTVVGGAIRVVAVVEIEICEIVSKDINVLTGVNGDATHLSTNELEYYTYIGRCNEKFDASSEFELPGVTNVLMVTPSVSVYNVIPKENYLVVSGKVGLDICSQTGENINDISTDFRSVDFNWEVAYDGINTSSIIQSQIGIVSNEIKVSTMVESGVASLSVNVPINYYGYVFAENKIEVVEDMYSEKNYLSITCENFNTITSANSISFKDNISGVASISETAPFIDDVLGVCTNNLVIASSRIVDNNLCIEGVANSTVTYYTKETSDITSVQVEMPFAIEKRVDNVDCNVVTICLENLSARSKRGKEIEVSAELNVYVDMYTTNVKCVVTEVVVGDEKNNDECPLYIYVVKPGQTVWDIAKDMNVSQELIMEQNPDVALPLKSGDKLVIYKPNIMKF